MSEVAQFQQRNVQKKVFSNLVSRVRLGVFVPRWYFTIFAHRDILNSPNLSPIAGIQTSLVNNGIRGKKYAPIRK